ncbi:MAG: DUF86 domain-containing protein [Bacteroidetes bacterium]|nr:DUF86 domain-containing protein [Bacteroidota bacterium]
MKRAVSLRIEDALDAMRMAEEFVEGMTLETFTGDIKTVFAVERCFTIIGEALRHVPDAVRNDHPEVPWRDILGMRNRIMHDYLRTDQELIWQTIHQDFPTIRPLLVSVFDQLDPEAADGS